MVKDTENNAADSKRFVVDFKVRYSFGVYTKGKKKGQPEIKEELITIVIPSVDPNKIESKLQEYCRKKNMQLLNWNVDGTLNAKHPFEFDCKYCGEHSIHADPGRREFCSEYCERKQP